MLKLTIHYFGHLMWTDDSLEKFWCWERLRAEGKEGVREWGGWTVSPIKWTWTWANSRRRWGTGRPGVLQSVGSHRVGHGWANEQRQEKHPHSELCSFCGPNLPGCLDWFRDRHVTQARPRELVMECLLGHLEKEMIWLVKLEERKAGTSGGHAGGNPSDSEGYQHYIKQSWIMVILMIPLQHLDPSVPKARSDLEMFSHVSWLFCGFPKASWELGNFGIQSK